MFRLLLSKLFKKREKMKGDDVKPFLDHLEDLRGTIFKMAGALVSSVAVCFIWNKELFHFLQRPLFVNHLNPTEVLVAHDVVGSFMASLTVSFYAGLIIAMPLIIYFLGEFVMPAMTAKEKKYALPALIAGFILFILGSAFCFYQIVPAAVKFFSEWGLARGIKTQYAVGNYFKLVTLMSLVFGLLCQLPVVMVTLHAIGIVTYEWIRSTRLYAYGGIVVLCGVVNPAPDIPSYVMLTLPIIGLYEICIWIIYFLEKRKKPEEPASSALVVATAAAAPYTAAQPEPHHDPHHHDDPYHHDEHDHYHDGHYHDDHYHHDHPEVNETPAAEPEKKTDAEPKPEEKPAENKPAAEDKP